MKKNILELSIALALVISCIIGAFAIETQNEISDKIIRLHVIANSNSNEDQSLKFDVRDKILEHIEKLTSNCKSKDEAKKIIEDNLSSLEEIANNVISSKNFNYSACAELSTIHFPTKEYDSFSLPSGKYEALRIKLGCAKGKNWWCVLFPPVCVSAAEVKTEFQNAGLSKNELDFIMSDDIEYKFKFKIIEIIKKISEKI